MKLIIGGTAAVNATVVADVKAAIAAKLAVVSVSAINANELKVTFSQKVDEATAETVTNYTINGKALIASNDKVTLNDDEKSVTIQFNGTAGAGVLKNSAGATQVEVATDGLLNNKTAYTIAVVANQIENEAKTEKVPAFSTGLYFSDTEKPTVKSVKAEENGDVTVTFSERLDTGSTVAVAIDGTNIGAGITVNADGTVTVAKANLPSSLENGKNYSIFVSGADDLVGNTMNLYNSTFTYNYVVTAPVFNTATVKDEKTIEIEFNKDVAALTGGTEIKVYKDNAELTAGGTDYTLAQVGTSNKKYSITLVDPAGTNKVYANNATTANVKVVAEGYKDTLNPANLGTKVEKIVTLQKDTVKPVLQGAPVYDATAGTLKVNFSEELDTVAAANLAPKLKVIGSDGVLTQVVATAAPGSVSVAGVTAAPGVKSFVLTNGSTALDNGNYTLIIEKDAVTDTSIDKNANNRIETSFTVTGSTVTAKPVLGTITNATPGTIVVPFTAAKVGVSATNPSNYKVNGVALPSTATITLNAAKDTATIILPAGYFESTASRIVTVANVLSVDGVKMDETSQAVTLKDNKKPELLSAKVNADKDIILTFNENVDDATTSVDFTAAMLEVKVNGIVVGDAAIADVAGEKTQKKITSAGTNFSTGTITIKVLNTATAADAAGNVVVGDTVVTATR